MGKGGFLICIGPVRSPSTRAQNPYPNGWRRRVPCTTTRSRPASPARTATGSLTHGWLCT